MSKSSSFIWLSELLENPELLKPPTYVVPSLVWENRVTLLAAPEKGGKSTLAGAAASALTTGSPFLGFPTKPTNVLLVSLEEHAQDFARRYVGFGADPSRIAILTNPSSSKLFDQVDSICEEVAPGLIVWDTLAKTANFMNPDIKSGEASPWLSILGSITEIAREHCAVWLNHHTRKSDGRYRDSTAIGGQVDMIATMSGKKDAPRKISFEGRFYAPDLTLKLENGLFKKMMDPEELQKLVLEFVRTHPKCSTRDLREGVDGRAKDIDAARNALLKAGKISNVGSAASHSYLVVLS